MNIKKRNIIGLFLQALLVGLLFVQEFMGQYSVFVTSDYGYRVRTSYESIFYEAIVKAQYHNAFVCYLTIGVIAIGLLAFIIQFIANDNSIAAAYIPVAEFIVLIIFALVEFNAKNIENQCKAGGIFYACLIITVILSAFSILGYQKAKKDGFVTDTATKKNAPVISNADELKKYKDLLDSGAITQDEYDAKKKQLLNL